MLSKTHFWDAMMRNEFLTENCTCGTERCLLNRRFQNPGIVKKKLWIDAYLTFFAQIFNWNWKILLYFHSTPSVDPLSKQLEVRKCEVLCPNVSLGVPGHFSLTDYRLVWADVVSTHRWHCSSRCSVSFFWSGSYLLDRFFSACCQLSSWEEWASTFCRNSVPITKLISGNV